MAQFWEKGKIGNRVDDHRGYPYPHIGTLYSGYLSARWTFPLPLNYPWYNALSERQPKCAVLLLPELAIQKSTLLQAGEKFWLQELRYTDILTQALSPPGLEDEVSSRGLGTRWFQRS